ncbi:hypothetical protein Fmac_022101 [Flemingia macrophylla]|uniref:Uncharacterized protein n=1 Tax=Flemingia macrophylla TaxID=520843 RepID=A0ABD1LYU0_9FABA
MDQSIYTHISIFANITIRTVSINIYVNANSPFSIFILYKNLNIKSSERKILIDHPLTETKKYS